MRKVLHFFLVRTAITGILFSALYVMTGAN